MPTEEPKRTKIPNGYLLTGKNGTMRVQGADDGDVTFGHENPEIGHVNITRLKRAIEKGKVEYDRIVGLLDMENTGQMLARRDIDPKVIEHLFRHPKKVIEPVIQVGVPPDVTLIDGTHRMFMHWLLNLRSIRMYVLTPEAIKPYQIRIWLNDKEIFPSADMIERMYQFGSPIPKKEK